MFKLTGRNRMPKQITLYLITANLFETFQFFFGFNTFRYGNHTKALADTGHQFDNSPCIRISCQIMDKSAVNFDLIKRKAAEAAE